MPNKTKSLKTTSLLISLLTFTSSASSEIFRWTDENGQIHFSDQVNAPLTAQTIKLNLDRINITSELSTSEQRQNFLKDHQQLSNKTHDKKKITANKVAWCSRARHHLQKIVGRVIFLDEKNQPVYVSEKERQDRAKKLSQDIQSKQCHLYTAHHIHR